MLPLCPPPFPVGTPLSCRSLFKDMKILFKPCLSLTKLLMNSTTNIFFRTRHVDAAHE